MKHSPKPRTLTEIAVQRHTEAVIDLSQTVTAPFLQELRREYCYLIEDYFIGRVEHGYEARAARLVIEHRVLHLLTDIEQGRTPAAEECFNEERASADPLYWKQVRITQQAYEEDHARALLNRSSSRWLNAINRAYPMYIPVKKPPIGAGRVVVIGSSPFVYVDYVILLGKSCFYTLRIDSCYRSRFRRGMLVSMSREYVYDTNDFILAGFVNEPREYAPDNSHDRDNATAYVRPADDPRRAYERLINSAKQEPALCA
jgi:hypothetical protein